jgi:hypothetical protein
MGHVESLRETRRARRILVGYREEWGTFGTPASKKQYNITRRSGKN